MTGPLIHSMSSWVITIYINLHKNNQTVKKGAAYAKKDSMKKVVKSKVVAQKWP